MSSDKLASVHELRPQPEPQEARKVADVGDLKVVPEFQIAYEVAKWQRGFRLLGLLLVAVVATWAWFSLDGPVSDSPSRGEPPGLGAVYPPVCAWQPTPGVPTCPTPPTTLR